jgi:large subunit ribosomal protein L32
VEIAMPVPKRKLSRSRRDMRSANKGLTPQSFGTCATDACGEPTLPHEVCMKCGFYRGKKVIATKMDRDVKRTDVRAQITAKQAASQVEGDQK